VANASWNILNYRLPLIRALQDAGHEVVLLAPRDEYTPQLTGAGFRWIDLPLDQRGVNPLVELLSLVQILKVYRRERPDIVHHFTPKCVIYGSIAARLAGVKKIVNTITGLGYVFSGSSAGQRIMQFIVRILYRPALSGARVVFQNPEDLENLLSPEEVRRGNFYQLGGTGVSLMKYMQTPEPGGPPVVMLPARLIEEKGVVYFVEAARILKRQGSQARFVLVGSPDANRRDSITAVTLRQWVSEGVIEWWGWQNDMDKIYPKANIVSLPTYYGEGVPKSLIEAAACARPIVASDIPGCRKVVVHGENGFLVPIKNAPALARAIDTLLEDADLRRKMGTKSRSIAEMRFSVRQNIHKYFSIYDLDADAVP
jgi:glycosyltransferase involved in cell wall biosynthesis